MHHEVERLVDLYDGGGLSRRRLLQGLFALSIGPHVANPLASALQEPGQTAPLFHTRTLNHVTLYASSVTRSKAFAIPCRCGFRWCSSMSSASAASFLPAENPAPIWAHK